MPENFFNGCINTCNGGGGGGGAAPVGDFSVNSAAVNGGYNDGSIVLRTGSRTNAAGSYNGGGTGNKSIFGAFGFTGLPIGSLTSLSYVWTNILGNGGPFYVPPTPAVMLTSGDSANVTKSGKRIASFEVNGVSVL